MHCAYDCLILDERDDVVVAGIHFVHNKIPLYVFRLDVAIILHDDWDVNNFFH